MCLRFLRLGFSQGSCTDTVCMEILNLVHASLTWCSKTTPRGDLLLLETPWAAGSPGFPGTKSFHAVTSAKVFLGAFTGQQLLFGWRCLPGAFQHFVMICTLECGYGICWWGTGGPANMWKEELEIQNYLENIWRNSPKEGVRLTKRGRNNLRCNMHGQLCWTQSWHLFAQILRILKVCFAGNFMVNVWEIMLPL